MTDEIKRDTTPAPPPAPEKTFYFKGVPIKSESPMVLVKGGTSTSSYDNEMARRAHEAETRRAHEDALRAKVESAPQDGAVGRIGAQKLVTAESPKLVLDYLNRDGSLRQQCISEITACPIPGDLLGGVDMMFTLVCPRCLERGLVSGESQLMIQNRHRKFHIDERKRNVIPVETPDGTIFVHIAGTVFVDDIIRCSNFNCNWTVRIDDSKVREV